MAIHEEDYTQIRTENGEQALFYNTLAAPRPAMATAGPTLPLPKL